MKQYYESEVLFQLMERDGFNIPSSVPPYESEIKAYLINQVKQAYPKLTDYEAEWLLYNYTKHLPADFPISSVSDVTEASFENVVPFAYQSAILKGQTLVNICKPYEFDIQTTGSGLRHIYDKNDAFNIPIQDDKQYSIWIEIDINEIGAFSLSYTGTTSTLAFNGTDGLTLTHGSTIIYPCEKRSNSSNVNLSIGALAGSTDGRLKGRIMVFEGDIRGFELSYFTGMQSVKMPVLTATGKNLFDFNRVETNDGIRVLWDTTINNGIITSIRKSSGGGEFGAYATIKVEPSTTYTLKMEQYKNDKSYDGEIYIYNNSSIWGNGLLTGYGNKDIVISTNADTKYITIGINYDNDIVGTVLTTKNIQLEKSSTSTQYEPYKTNILTVNEEVELSGIGDVQDTLDCLTGEVTQRIEEVVLDGSEGWEHRYSQNGENTLLFQTEFGNRLSDNKVNAISNKIIGVSADTQWSNDIESVSFNAFGYLGLRINKIKLATQDINGLKQYLSQNPITVQYKLETESIKTVDLTTVNEKGETTYFMPLEGTMHVQSSGEIIQPSFDMTVPVEATTQNLASFIDLEMRNNHE